MFFSSSVLLKEMFGSGARRTLERLPQRNSARAAAHPQRDSLPPELGDQRVGHTGAGRHRRRLLLGHHRPPRATHTLSDTVSERQEATSTLHRLLDTEPLRPLGGASAPRSLLEAAHRGAPQEDPGRE